MRIKRFFQWLPVEHRAALLQRLLIVWVVALPIAVGTWVSHRGDGFSSRFDVSLVYAYAISTCIWLFTDVARFVLARRLRAKAPHYWPPAPQASLMLLLGVSAGYMLGTLLGDAYAGWSTWDLWRLNPNRFISFLVMTVAISSAFVAFFYQRAKAQALAAQVTQSQLMLLQAQLEPHMLFNTLAHLRALIGQDTARAHAMLDHLNDYLRTTLLASRQPLQPLSNEFARLHDYLSLMAIRMGPRLAFALELPPALAALPVPSFILQPLVENAIRHGLEPVVGGGWIEVQASASASQLTLRVRDNGCGISELAQWEAMQPLSATVAQPLAQRFSPPLPASISAPLSAPASWGLRHVRERLHTLYGDQAQMHIHASPSSQPKCETVNLQIANPESNPARQTPPAPSSPPSGTEVVLTLPLRPAP